MTDITRLNVSGSRVRCIMDWGHFQSGSLYYVQGVADVRQGGITETVCTVFLGPEPCGGARSVLLCDLKDFFRLEEDLDAAVTAYMCRFLGEDYFKAPWASDSTGMAMPRDLARFGAEWERGRLIDRACRWVVEHADMYDAFDVDSRTYYMKTDSMARDLRKALEALE